MNPSSVYLLLCVLGTSLPLSQFMPWVISQPLDAGIVGRFFAELFSTRIGGFFGMDVIVSAVVLFTFIHFERRHLAIRLRWLPVMATLLVGVSLGLPLYLYLRQRAAMPLITATCGQTNAS